MPRKLMEYLKNVPAPIIACVMIESNIIGQMNRNAVIIPPEKENELAA